MSPDGTPRDPPEPHALIAGHVLEAATRVNSISGVPYWWALVETVGGTFDAVIDPELLADAPRPGNVLAGWFWLSGRLMTGAPRRRVCPAGCSGSAARVFYGRFRKPLSAIHSSSRSAQRSTGRVFPARSPNPWPPVL